LIFFGDLLFNGKSTRKEKETVKEKNRATSIGNMGSSEENGSLLGWTFRDGDKGKKEASDR